MFISLADRLALCTKDTGDKKVAEKLEILIKELPCVSLVAFNGIPFVGDPPTYFGLPVNYSLLKQQIALGLGLGGVLTHLSSPSLEELANISLKKGHDWAMHTLGVTVCFSGCPTFVEMSFGRDGGFHLSWVEPKGPTDWNKPRVFTASASLKKWKKYLSNRNSPDFLATQRKWLNEAHTVIQPLFPEYFGTRSKTH